MAEVQLPDPEVQIRLATFDQYRGLLFSVAYRMLGSVADAEDMLQETFIRWQQAHKKEIRSPRAFLVTVISRLSINHMQSARVQREEYFGEWLPEPIVTALGSDPLELLRVDESLSMAFLVMTAEDELADGGFQPRANVIHETGLFQGRLGFAKAIVLAENETKLFSNLDGIQQIRFGNGNIRESFGDVLAAIRREFPGAFSQPR